MPTRNCRAITRGKNNTLWIASHYEKNIYQVKTYELPWLKCDLSTNKTGIGESSVLHITIDKTKAQPGTNLGIIFIRTNDQTNSIVKVPVWFEMFR